MRGGGGGGALLQGLTGCQEVLHCLSSAGICARGIQGQDERAEGRRRRRGRERHPARGLVLAEKVGKDCTV
jgi:hypothetical protein